MKHSGWGNVLEVLMRSLFLCLIALSFISAPAFAESFFLFSVKKPVKPENLVMVYIPLGPNCEPGRLDFAWGMSNASCIKPPNATLHCVTLKSLQEMRPVAGHKAACPPADQLPPGSKCYTKFITAQELGYVGVNPASMPVVIRAEKSASTGRCKAAAFADVNGTMVQISQIAVNADVHDQGMTSATVTIRGIDFLGPDRKVAASLPCRGCGQRTISADRSGCGISFGTAQQAPWPNFGRPQCQ